MATNPHHGILVSSFHDFENPEFIPTTFHTYGECGAVGGFLPAVKQSSYSELSRALIDVNSPLVSSPCTTLDSPASSPDIPSEPGGLDCHDYVLTDAIDFAMEPDSTQEKSPSPEEHLDSQPPVKIECMDASFDRVVFEPAACCDAGQAVVDHNPRLRSNPRHKKTWLRAQMQGMMGVFHVDPFASRVDGSYSVYPPTSDLDPAIMTFKLDAEGANGMDEVEDPEARYLSSILLGSLLSFDDSDEEGATCRSHGDDGDASYGSCSSLGKPGEASTIQEDGTEAARLRSKHCRAKKLRSQMARPRKERALVHHCDRCNKAFNRPSGLAMHMHTHSGLKPFVCPIASCGKRFSVRSNARRHYHTHNDGKRSLPPALLFDAALPQECRARAYSLWLATGQVSADGVPQESDDGEEESSSANDSDNDDNLQSPENVS
ncbi:hypothetical protein PUNSTDRAFT_143968 [Punctularia strigosozonata HHB-11173 SS5]|uniref:uncharacterized protein n=1 Tax=Punctularia strigosozonata (strain HHB-11173) TaxID=741275 RepID=UPI0004416747|nr:uncharacterized protein PUNSTDRAFT_143968 [Punctularia strigosozonata HHB-11173 SS5]EIN08346.1 hypothetical protein PUNSTDRAFT_143968 [Punctularia strigosozonata HHB-11173 SS5]